MSRSLDFTACTRECLTPCWRKLTKEEEKWLETHANRMAYCDFADCPDYKPKGTDKNEMPTDKV